MQILVLDKNFDVLGPVSVFTSLIWTRRYYETGVFELHTPVDEFGLLSAGKYLYRNDRTELGVIRQVSYSMNERGIRTAYCKGFFAEDILNDRVIDTQQRLTGTPERIGRTLVDKFFISPTDTGRKIQNLRLGGVSNTGTSISVTATGDCVGDKLYEIEKTQNMSHRLIYDYLTNDLIFDVWQGRDRTDKQTENSWAIFSNTFYNIKKADYSRDESSFKNYAYVAGALGNAQEISTWGDLVAPSSSGDRMVVTVDLRTSSDEERRELYVDARDLQKTYKDADGEERTYTNEEYRAILMQRGLEKLKAYEVLEAASGEVDPDANLIYVCDYDLGDLCIQRFTDIGIECTKRITEVTETIEGNARKLSLTLGSDSATSIIKLIKREVS